MGSSSGKQDYSTKKNKYKNLEDRLGRKYLEKKFFVSTQN